MSARNLDEVLKDITSFVHICIDLLCNVRVSSQHKKESEKTRAEYSKKREKEIAERNAEVNNFLKQGIQTKKDGKNATTSCAS
jgi:hypothetical protein